MLLKSTIVNAGLGLFLLSAKPGARKKVIPSDTLVSVFTFTQLDPLRWMNHTVTIMSSVMVGCMMQKSLMGKIMDDLPIKVVLTRAQETV